MFEGEAGEICSISFPGGEVGETQVVLFEQKRPRTHPNHGRPNNRMNALPFFAVQDEVVGLKE